MKKPDSHEPALLVVSFCSTAESWLSTNLFSLVSGRFRAFRRGRWRGRCASGSISRLSLPPTDFFISCTSSFLCRIALLWFFSIFRSITLWEGIDTLANIDRLPDSRCLRLFLSYHLQPLGKVDWFNTKFPSILNYLSPFSWRSIETAKNDRFQACIDTSPQKIPSKSLYHSW